MQNDRSIAHNRRQIPIWTLQSTACLIMQLHFLGDGRFSTPFCLHPPFCPAMLPLSFLVALPGCPLPPAPQITAVFTRALRDLRTQHASGHTRSIGLKKARAQILSPCSRTVKELTRSAVDPGVKPLQEKSQLQLVNHTDANT